MIFFSFFYPILPPSTPSPRAGELGNRSERRFAQNIPKHGAATTGHVKKSRILNLNEKKHTRNVFFFFTVCLCVLFQCYIKNA